MKMYVILKAIDVHTIYHLIPTYPFPSTIPYYTNTTAQCDQKLINANCVATACGDPRSTEHNLQ